MKKSLFFLRTLLALIAVGFASVFRVRPRFPLVADPLAREDVYGTSATKTRANPVQKIDVIDLGARIRYLNEVYTQGSADGAIGDVIHLPGLPVGAKVIGHLSRLEWGAGNAGATLKLGKTGDDAALLAATSISAAGNATCLTPAAGADDLTLADGEELIATNATAAIKAAQSIRFRIAYVENS